MKPRGREIRCCTGGIVLKHKGQCGCRGACQFLSDRKSLNRISDLRFDVRPLSEQRPRNIPVSATDRIWLYGDRKTSTLYYAGNPHVLFISMYNNIKNAVRMSKIPPVSTKVHRIVNKWRHRVIWQDSIGLIIVCNMLCPGLQIYDNLPPGLFEWGNNARATRIIHEHHSSFF